MSAANDQVSAIRRTRHTKMCCPEQPAPADQTGKFARAWERAERAFPFGFSSTRSLSFQPPDPEALIADGETTRLRCSKRMIVIPPPSR